MGLTAFRVLVHETVAEIAAPHQNEGPHLAAGQPARISADRSGARGKRRPARNTYAEKRPTGSRTGAVPSQVRSHSPHCDFRRAGSRCPDFPAARQKPARSGQRLPPRSKKKLTEMGEWELGLSLPPHAGASRWSAMGAQLEVQPQIN